MAKLELTLSDVVNNVNDVAEFQTQISDDGRFVFMSNYQYFTPVIAASLYQNNSGKLSLLGTLPVDPNYPIVSSGASSDDFSRFVILDQGNGDALGNGRLRVFRFDFVTNTFVLVGSPLIFNDVNLSTISLNISKLGITHDNHYALISYINTVSTTPSYESVLKIIDLTTNPLTVVSAVTFVGFSNGAYFFQLKDGHHRKQTYVVLPSTGEDSVTFANIAPAQIAFYRLDSGILTPVGTPISQPQFVNSAVPFTYKLGRKILIAVTTWLAVLPGAPTVYDLSQTVPSNSLNGETEELRIYEFDGNNAHLVFKKSLDNFAYDVAWFPDGKHLAVILQAGFTNLNNIACSGTFYYSTTNPGIFQIYDVTASGKRHVDLKPNDFPRVAPGGFAIIEFSKNGKWLILGGGGPTFPSDVFSTNLYRVEKIEEESCKSPCQPCTVIYPQRCCP